MSNNNLPVVSIVIVNYNGRRFLDTCFNSLLAVDYPQKQVEIIMVDNGSKDGSIQYMKDTFSSVKVVVNNQNNYARANNLGIKNSSGKYVVFINNDITVERNWLIELVRCAEADPTIGVVGSKILFKNGLVQSLGLTHHVNFYWGDIGFHSRDCEDYVVKDEIVGLSGCSAMYRRECLDVIGGFDEDFNMYLEDVDLGMRCRNKNWKLVICPRSTILHEFHGTIGSETSARKLQEANRLLLVAKYWPDKLIEALRFNRGYYFSMPGATRVERDKEFAEALRKVIMKLHKEHGEDTAVKFEADIALMQQAIISEDIVSPLEELSPSEKEIMKRDERIIQLSLILGRKDAEITSKIISIEHFHKKIEELELQITELNNRLTNKEDELRGVYASTGYRYLLRPIWDIIFPFKQAARRPPESIKHLKELWHHSYGPNSWKDAYFKHLNYGTYPPYPETAVLMLTKRCNLHCVFCDITNINEEMGFEDAQKVIDNVSKLKATLLVITGGEPLLHPQLFNIVKYAKNKGLKVCITTNGTLIDEYFDEIVDSRVDVLSVSLDGLGPIHDTLRNKPGLAEKVKEAILRVKKLEPKGQTVSINFVITNKNLGELEQVYRWAQREKIFMDFWPVNSHPELHININDEYAKLQKFIMQLKAKGELSPEKCNYFFNIPFYCGLKQPLRVRCLALMRQFGIDMDGSIRLCCVWDFKHDDLGNAIRDNLEELWHSPKYRQARRALYYHGCNAGCYNNALHQFTGITGKNFIVSGR